MADAAVNYPMGGRLLLKYVLGRRAINNQEKRCHMLAWGRMGRRTVPRGNQFSELQVLDHWGSVTDCYL